MVSFFVIIDILLLVSNIPNSLQIDYLPILEEFRIKDPYYIVESFNLHHKNLIKHHSQNNELSMVCKNATEIPIINTGQIKSVIQITKSDEDIGKLLEPLLSLHFPTLILLIANSSQKTNFKSLKILIHQQILFYFQDTKELFEVYMIHTSNIVRRLGTLNQTIFLWDQKVNPNFVRRRSDFQGVALNVMAEFEGNSINANPDYKTFATYFPENETYLLNGFTYGLYHDVLEILQEHLNFSAQIFKRRDGQWGMVYPQKDGTFKTVGFIGDLFLKKADFAIGNVIIFQNRAQYVDYLPAVGIYQGGVFLPSLEASERIDWAAFLRPFKIIPWLLIIGSVFISSIVSAIILYSQDTLTIMKSINIFWTNFQAFFDEAANLDNSLIDLRNSRRLATFVSLLWAWFIWTSYNAALASEFTVPIVKLPFTDMESLSTTNYRLLVKVEHEELFTTAPIGSVLSRVNQNNLHTDPDISVKSILESRKKLAYYDSISNFLEFEEYKACSIKEIFRYKLGDIGFPISQGSPYRLFLEQAIIDITERGKLERLQKKWMKPKPDCGPVLVSGKALDFKKMAGPFMVFLFGLVVSIFVMVVERIIGDVKKINHSTKLKVGISNSWILGRIKNDIINLQS